MEVCASAYDTWINISSCENEERNKKSCLRYMHKFIEENWLCTRFEYYEANVPISSFQRKQKRLQSTQHAHTQTQASVTTACVSIVLRICQKMWFLFRIYVRGSHFIHGRIKSFMIHSFAVRPSIFGENEKNFSFKNWSTIEFIEGFYGDESKSR